MTLLHDPRDSGYLRRAAKEYRRLRRDQAAHHPGLTMRMSRRAALGTLWQRRFWL